MKTKLITLISLIGVLCFSSLNAQETKDKDRIKDENGNYFQPDITAKFKNKDVKEFKNFIVSELKYPQAAAENGIQGTVFVEFIVDEKGSVKNAKVARGVDPVLDAEALRVINKSPKWIPAEHEGKNVPVIFTFPINFKLQNKGKC